MSYDTNDTIVAIGTASRGGARGMVRVSGPAMLDCLSACFVADELSRSLAAIGVPSVVSGFICTDDLSAKIPCDLFIWPSAKSYTRQPTAELHTLGSPPLLEAIVRTVCRAGARLAEPGEFTLRAFLAGRIDLTQAEAVLGVIDARSQSDLETALSQLAGGLSGPLMRLREQLLHILAELEAGLDFADEDLEFIAPEELCRVLRKAQEIVAATIEQVASRTDSVDLPRVVFTGPPNVGKSSLFNALVDSCKANESTSRAIVSEHSGTTRDYVTAVVDFGGVVCELVDTAGEDDSFFENSIDGAAQKMASEQQSRATIQVKCVEAPGDFVLEKPLHEEPSLLVVLTKADLAEVPVVGDSVVACSSLTGAGIDALRQQIGARIEQASQQEGSAVGITAIRCAESLSHANETLKRALGLAVESGVEELIAAEVRVALLDLGQVVGVVYTDDILDRIFSQFCIGK